MSYNNKVNNALKFYLFIYTIQVISGILFPIYYSPSSNYLYLWYTFVILSSISLFKFFFTLQLQFKYQINEDSPCFSFKHILLILETALSSIFLFSFFYYSDSIAQQALLYKILLYQRIIFIFIIIPIFLIIFIQQVCYYFFGDTSYDSNHL
jgi:hypothetical protein